MPSSQYFKVPPCYQNGYKKEYGIRHLLSYIKHNFTLN
ncbi:hypothetical protein B4087_4545 [Bacillus cereus]|nr:hypothetical protein B4087_4545 [Bacillus cereus]